MKVPNTSAQKKFLKGLQKIYRKLFQNVKIRFLDDSTEIDSVYGESTAKKYQPPIEILGHFQRTRVQDQDPVKETDEVETVKIPIQEFLDKGIPFSSWEDLEVLRQIIIQVNGLTYTVEEVNPRSMIAGQFLVCSFTCQPYKDYVPDEYDEVETDGSEDSEELENDSVEPVEEE